MMEDLQNLVKQIDDKSWLCKDEQIGSHPCSSQCFDCKYTEFKAIHDQELSKKN